MAYQFTQTGAELQDLIDRIYQIAEEYDPGTSYVIGDYCSSGGKVYRCTAATTGTFEPSKWTDSVIVMDAIKSLKGRMDTAEGDIDAAQSDIVSLKAATTWQSVTLTAGSNVTINMQQAYKLGKLLVIRANIQVTTTIAAYATLLTHGYNAKCGWIAPIYSASFVPVENKGVYGDASNTTIRNASSLPAGAYTISVIIPCE